MCLKSVPITTKVVRLNPAHIGVYSKHQYVIKVVSDLRQVGGFLPGTPVSSTNKTNITEIVLKLALNTIKPNLNLQMCAKQTN